MPRTTTTRRAGKWKRWHTDSGQQRPMQACIRREEAMVRHIRSLLTCSQKGRKKKKFLCKSGVQSLPSRTHRRRRRDDGRGGKAATTAASGYSQQRERRGEGRGDRLDLHVFLVSPPHVFFFFFFLLPGSHVGCLLSFSPSPCLLILWIAESDFR